jgi:hypothetical protein
MSFASSVNHLDGDEIDFRDIVMPREHLSVLFRPDDDALARDGICAGDFVIVERGHRLLPGRLVLVTVGGEPRLLRLRRSASGFTFDGMRSADDVELLGTASRIVRLLLPPFGPQTL